MLEIVKRLEAGKAFISIKGHLDAITNEIFDQKMLDIQAQEYIIDCKDLDYITSTGLLSFLNFYKKIKDSATIKLLNVNERIFKIFDMVGFDQIFTIERSNES